MQTATASNTADISNNTASIGTYSSSISNNATNIATNTLTIGNLQSNSNTHSTDITSNTSAINATNVSVSALNSIVTNNTSDISTLQNKTINLTTNLFNGTSTGNLVQSDLSTIESNVSALQTLNSANTADISTNSSAIANNTASIITTNSNLSNHIPIITWVVDNQNSIDTFMNSYRVIAQTSITHSTIRYHRLCCGSGHSNDPNANSSGWINNRFCMPDNNFIVNFKCPPSGSVNYVISYFLDAHYSNRHIYWAVSTSTSWTDIIVPTMSQTRGRNSEWSNSTETVYLIESGLTPDTNYTRYLFAKEVVINTSCQITSDAQTGWILWGGHTNYASVQDTYGLDESVTMRQSVMDKDHLPPLTCSVYQIPFNITNFSYIGFPSNRVNLPWISSSTTNGWFQVKHIPPNGNPSLTGNWSWYSGNDWGFNNPFGTNTIGTVSNNINSSEWQRTITDTLTSASLSNYTEICFQSLDGTYSTQPHKWLIMSKSSFSSLIQTNSHNPQNIPTTIAHAPSSGTPIFQNLTSNGDLDPMIWIQTSAPAYYHLYAEDDWGDYNSIANTGKSSQMEGGMGVFIR